MRKEATAVALAMRHPATPWYAKALGAIVVAYALSPVDLVPDFIPVLGVLDDLLLLPLGIAIIVRLTPKRVMDECREKASQAPLVARSVGIVLVLAAWVIALGTLAVVLALCAR